MAVSREELKKVLEGGVAFNGEKIELKDNDVFIIKEFQKLKDYYAIRINDNGDFIFSSYSLTRLIDKYGEDAIGTEIRFIGQSTFKGKDGKTHRVNNYELA